MVAGVNLLQHAGRRRGGAGRHGGAAQAVPQQELLVVLFDLQDLENARPRRLERRLGLRVPHLRLGRGAQRRQGLVEAGRRRPLALKERRVRNPPVLLQEAILLQRQLVKLVADGLVLLQRFQKCHGSGGKRRRIADPYYRAK